MRKGNHKHEHRKKSVLLKNPWRVSTAVLGIIALIFLVLSLSGGIKGIGAGKILSASDAGGKLVSFLNKQTQGEIKYISAKDMGNLYKVIVSYKNQQVPVYITKDGKYFVQGAIPLSDNRSNQQSSSQNKIPTNIPKSDKPSVKLFVMAYCPYGTQMEKGIISVVRKLSDKINFKIEFVNYAMHYARGEVGEELNQYCIQKEQNDKYLDYLSCFLKGGNGAGCLKEIKINSAKLKTCTGKTDKEFDVTKNLEDKSSWAGGRFPKFMIYDAENKKYGVQGSPTLVINDQKVQSGRSAQNLLNTICSAFITKPKECDSNMTSFGTPAPGFGFGSQGGSASSAGCGA